MYNSGFGTFGRHIVFNGHSNRDTSGITYSLSTTSTASTITTSVQPNTSNIANKKWVINLSSTPSLKHRKPFWPGDLILQVSRVLSKGGLHHSNRRSLHQTPPKEAVELGKNQLGIKEELPPSKPNIKKEEFQAITELTEDHSRVILTADKGVTMGVMDRQDHSNKAPSY